MNDLDLSERLELLRLRKFVRRLDYLRRWMAAGEQAMLDALTDDARRRVLDGLDRSA